MKMYKTIKTILIIILISLVTFSVIYLTYSFAQKNKNKEEITSSNLANTATQVDMEKQLLEEQIDKSNLFISEISKTQKIMITDAKGNYIIAHDKTPNGSAWTEWLVNSDITVSLDFKAIYTIMQDKVSYTVDKDGIVNISFKPEHINVDALDILNISFSENLSLLGIKYSKEDLLALNEIAREEIIKKLSQDESITKILPNLDNHFISEAKRFGIDKIVLNGKQISVSTIIIP